MKFNLKDATVLVRRNHLHLKLNIESKNRGSRFNNVLFLLRINLHSIIWINPISLLKECFYYADKSNLHSKIPSENRDNLKKIYYSNQGKSFYSVLVHLNYSIKCRYSFDEKYENVVLWVSVLLTICLLEYNYISRLVKPTLFGNQIKLVGVGWLVWLVDFSRWKSI